MSGIQESDPGSGIIGITPVLGLSSGQDRPHSPLTHLDISQSLADTQAVNISVKKLDNMCVTVTCYTCGLIGSM